MDDVLSDKIDRTVSMREEAIDQIEDGDVPAENLPRAKRNLASDCRAIAVYQFVLGECSEGRAEFRAAADHYRTALELTRDRHDAPQKGEPIRLRMLLEAALLSGDDDLVEAAADLTLETPPSFVETYPVYDFYHYYAMALATAIAETGELESFLQRLDDAVEDLDPEHTEGDVRGHYRSRSSALAGIASRDEAQFDSGISDVLAHHAESSSLDSTQPKELVCIGGAALLVLARRKGMDVHVDSEFVPECVYEIA